MSESAGLVSSGRTIIARIHSQLTMKQLVWISLAVLIAVLPQVYRLPMWFLPMTILVFGYRFYVQLNHLKKAYNIILMLLSLLTLVLIIYSQGFGLSREISVTILITMTVLKLLETFQLRDGLMVVILCFFVTMTRFLYSQDLLLLVYLFASVWIITIALRVLNYQANEQLFDRKEIRSTGGWIALSIPFAAMFFLVFPRLGAPIWGSPDIFGDGKTGISDSMSPGSIIELFMDDSPAFRVTFDNGVMPQNNQLYWRGPVLSNFDGQTWSRGNPKGLRLPLRNPDPTTVVSYQIELEPTGQNYLFGLDYISRSFDGANLLADSMLYSSTKINQLKHYNLSSALLARFPDQLSDNNNQHLLDFPAGSNSQTQELINQWLQNSNNKYELINKSMQWFNQDEFYYSYTPPPLSGDVIDQFLFESKRGFCEHFASSFTIMMRMAGIPARVVTGYQGGINNGEYLLVKQSDAHAWSEVFIEESPGVGYWLRIDPTSMVAPERVESGSRQIMDEKRSLVDFEWLKNMKESMDKYRYQWNKWVRDFNVSKQQALFKALGFEHRDGKNIAIMMITVIAFTTSLILLVLWYLQRKQYHQLQKIYLQLVSLSKKNPPLYSEHIHGIEHFSQALVTQYPYTKAKVEHFLKLYLTLRYSKQDKQKQTTIAHLQSTLSNIKTIIKNHPN